jgi:hypothetical protein
MNIDQQIPAAGIDAGEIGANSRPFASNDSAPQRHADDDECGCERLDNGECGCISDRIARGAITP